MRILLLGAGGFIGRQALAELLAAGHEVTAVARTSADLAASFPMARYVAIDLAAAAHAADWTAALAGVDVVVNAAGVLRGRDMEAVHVTAPLALYEAARAAGVKRAVLISAISARPEVPTDYAQSKLRGEDALRASGLGWTILRPSLVYGEGSYGGTSLMRGLAALPGFVPLPGGGDFAFTPIHVQDLARTIRGVCEDADFNGQTLEPVGPETLSLRDLLARYRAWLGFGPARFASIPMAAMQGLGRLGDVLGAGPVSTNSLVQMVAGNAGDSDAFAKSIGFTPRSLASALARSPAQTQDRWHARLFLLAPAVRATLALLWLASGALGLIMGSPRTAELIVALGWPMALAAPLRVGSSLMDLALAVLVLRDRSGRWATPAQGLVIVGYTALIGWALPALWLDPLGSLLKNLPILALVLVHGAIADPR